MIADPALDPAERVYVALDLPDVREARRMVDALDPVARRYKIGYQLALAGGLDLARELVGEGHGVFLDMKLLDIGATVGHAVESALALGVSALTLHAYPQAMRAAAEAARGGDLTLLAVTVLTSMHAGDLAEAGYGDVAPAELVRRRALQAAECGMGGIVCSAQEARAVRDAVGDGMAVVTPGIRPAGAARGDQVRVATPGSAIRDGASHLVVGRPITRSDDPVGALRAILDEIEATAAA